MILQLDRLRTRLGRALLDPRDREACDAMVADALDGSQRVAQIVRDLLQFAREDGGTRAPVDLREVIDTAVKLATSALRHRATLERRIGEVAAVSGNAARLAQVFLNLVVNAAQAFEHDAPDRNHVWIDARDDGDRVIVDVADDGPGIPEDLRRRVLEPFFTTKEVGSGTGLGLDTVRRIVEDRHDGSIGFDTGPEGTTFHVWLPLNDRPATAEATTP